MFRFSYAIENVPGIGPKTAEALHDKEIFSIRDLLLWLPLRYEDRSQRKTIEEIVQSFSPETAKQFWTVEAEVVSAQQVYRKGRNMQRAVITDGTGKLQLTWFNNKYVLQKLKKGKTLLFSGTVKPMGKSWFMTQPLVEDATGETIHTDRLVPIYPRIADVKPAAFRKILKDVSDHIEALSQPKVFEPRMNITSALQQLHFPDDEQKVIQARERLALEELIQLIELSHQVKREWEKQHTAPEIKELVSTNIEKLIPKKLPFELTGAQKRSLTEIIEDLQSDIPMNRLLIGDVGSGKTIVAGIAMQQVIKAGFHACLVAPTQVLAEQHAKTLRSFFPDLEIKLITGSTKTQKSNEMNETPSLIIGTHAVLNWIEKRDFNTIKIGMVVFDEQHRFGVSQRSSLQELQPQPHILTMTATPIPRSLMLTIFSHLSLSLIDELPANRLPTKTWLIPHAKKKSMFDWIAQQNSNLQSPTSRFLTLYICPFIDPSDAEALENVASVKQKFEEIKKYFSKTDHQDLTISYLHGRQKKKEQQQVIDDLYAGKINILVTTPIVEVGIDLPQASAIIIDSSERFGLASLHQLRGRVGRAGQQGFCFLMTNSKNPDTKDRLQKFTEILSGQKLAELDLKNRGAGNLFGVEQHGFDQLQFAAWDNVSLITEAKKITDKLKESGNNYESPLLKKASSVHVPQAN